MRRSPSTSAGTSRSPAARARDPFYGLGGGVPRGRRPGTRAVRTTPVSLEGAAEARVRTVMNPSRGLSRTERAARSLLHRRLAGAMRNSSLSLTYCLNWWAVEDSNLQPTD